MPENSRKFGMSMGRLIVIALAIALAGFVAGYGLCRHHAPHLLVESLSPDGRFRVVVMEQAPDWPKVSPHTFRLSIWLTAPNNAPLSGNEAVFTTDSYGLAAHDFHFEWNGYLLKVILPPAAAPSLSASFDGNQQWSVSGPMQSK